MDPTTQAIDELFGELSGASPGCALGVMRGGDTLLVKSYGLADLEHQVPITPRSMFYMASVSKQFTAFAVLLLVEDGKLRLTDSIRKTIPELPAYADAITLYHLLTHTSGVRDYLMLAALSGLPNEFVHTDTSVLKLITRQEGLNSSPGDEFLYSNSGYFLLALVVKRVTGKPLDDFARERIFDPLGMTTTRFQHDHSSLVSGKAHGYEWRSETWHTSDSMLNVVGDGGLYSCVEDMLLWLRNLDEPKIGAEALATMQARGRLSSGQEIDYGMGLAPSVRGPKAVMHSGGLGGYRTATLCYPDHKLSIVLCANNGSLDAMALAYRLAALYLPEAKLPEPSSPPLKAAETDVADPLPAIVQQSYAGEYRSHELESSCHIVCGPEGLSLALPRWPEMLLHSVGDDAMQAGADLAASLTIRFLRDGDGTVTGFALDALRIKGLDFHRLG